ncbi:Glyoxalase/Bleomycin resistance protein/Dihydroxybiphenyl dioxygenase [Aspergillus nidulans var. acristatus]
MRYQHSDIDEITTFLQDFGMSVAKRTDSEVWYRGYGEDQYVYYARKGPKQYLGGTFQVARRLPQAAEIQQLSDAPGGGYLVRFSNPEGFPVNLIFGQRNLAFADFSFGPGPAGVHKLGHPGLCTTQLSKANEPTSPSSHINLGETYVDHYCFFINSNATSHLHHCSFEVHEFDTQKLGHQWLAKKGYKPVWGVGRHILGPQIFYYWWDTTGNTIEHYADGDLVNDQTPVEYGPADDESLAVWGAEVPSWFFQ